MAMAEPVRAPKTAPTKSLRVITTEPAQVPLVRALGIAVNELAGFVRNVPVMRSYSTVHDRQPVLVLPGFLAHDAFTLGLRMLLADRGFPVHGWKLGVNIGPTDKILDGLRARVLEISERHGQPVSIIGWSLGGLYARQLAREYPEHVRQVITLGSPINLTLDDTHLTAVHTMFERMKRFYSTELAELGMPEHEKAPLLVPSSSIFTRRDEVVPWDTCVDRTGHRHLSENIEVRGTHVGLAQNRSVAHAVLDRLSMPLGKWTHFAPHPQHAHHYRLHGGPDIAPTLDGR